MLTRIQQTLDSLPLDAHASSIERVAEASNVLKKTRQDTRLKLHAWMSSLLSGDEILATAVTQPDEHSGLTNRGPGIDIVAELLQMKLQVESQLTTLQTELQTSVSQFSDFERDAMIVRFMLDDSTTILEGVAQRKTSMMPSVRENQSSASNVSADASLQGIRAFVGSNEPSPDRMTALMPSVRENQSSASNVSADASLQGIRAFVGSNEPSPDRMTALEARVDGIEKIIHELLHQDESGVER